MSAKERIARNIVKTLPVSWREQVIHGKLKIILHVDAEVVDDLIAEMTGGDSKAAKMKRLLQETEKMLDTLLFQARQTLVKPQGLPARMAEELLPLAWAEQILLKLDELKK